MRALCSLALCGLLVLPGWVSAATDWVVKLPGGAELAITEDPMGNRNPFRLERRQPGIGLDRQFGQAGSVPLFAGEDNTAPTGLRVDTQGGVIVIGFNLNASRTRVPVLMRFDARGAPDRRWGPGGRLLTLAFGSDLAPEDVWPMADGSVIAIGTSEGKVERAVAWRVGADGRLDSGFGRGGWLVLPIARGAEGLSLAMVDSLLMFGVLTGQDGRPMLEVHRWDPAKGGDPVVVARQPMPEDWVGQPSFAQRNGQWGWLASAEHAEAKQPWVAWQMLLPVASVDRPAASAAAAEPVPASAAGVASDGAVAFSPYATTGSTAPVRKPAVDEVDTSSSWLAWAVGGLVAALAAVFLLRRRSSS